MAAKFEDVSVGFEIKETLGGGCFSIAYLVVHQVYGQVVFKKLESSSEGETNQFKHESDIQMRLNHPNIVKCLGRHCVDTTCGLFLENMTHGTVVDLIENFSVTWQWKIKIINDIAQAMSYLHDQQPSIIHGDLKPQNILINDRFRAKVSDFGLSCLQRTTKTSADNRICGTLPYVAPEYLENREKQKTVKFDVYGFAISIWEILSEKKHWNDFTVSQTIDVFVINGKRPSLDEITRQQAIPDAIVGLIEICWDKQELKRPTFQDIVRTVSCEFIEIDETLLKEPIILNAEQQTFFLQLIPQASQTRNTKSAKINIQTEEDRQKFVHGFNLVSLSLTKYIDSENGLLRSLKTFGVLTRKEYEILDDKTPYRDRNDHMIERCIAPCIVENCRGFVEALNDNDQEHIVKFIMCAGKNEDEDRLLSDEEIRIIDNNMFGLVNLINPYKMEFLYRLVTKNCITSRHKEKVESRQESTKKVDELLTILKRRSYRDLCNFRKCLHDTMQNRIAQLLESSGLVAIRVELEERPDRQFIESALIAHMTDYVEKNCGTKLKLTDEQNHFIDNILKELEVANINLIGSSTWQSMAVYFMCSAANSQKEIQHKFKSGRLKEILEQVFRVLYKLPECCPNLIKSVYLHKLPLKNPDPDPSRQFLKRMATSSELTKKVYEITECPICQETMSSPKLLPCVHTFCLTCLIETSAGNIPGDTLTCPMCRKEFPLPEGGCSSFPNNFFIGNLIDAHAFLKEKSRCEMRDNDEQVLGGIENNGQRMAICEQHPEQEIQVVCLDCKSMICLSCCFLQNHPRSHDVRLVCEAVEELRVQINTNMEEINNRISSAVSLTESHLKEIDEIETKVSERGAELKRIIGRNIERSLDELKTLKLEKFYAKGTIFDRIRQQEIAQTNFRECISKMDSEIVTYDEIQTLANSVSDQLEEIRTHPLVTEETFESISLSRSHFGVVLYILLSILDKKGFNFIGKISSEPERKKVFIRWIGYSFLVLIFAMCFMRFTPDSILDKSTGLSSIQDRNATLLDTIPFNSNVVGITIMGDVIYRVARESKYIMIYDSRTFKTGGRIEVAGMRDPWSIASYGGYVFVSEHSGKRVYRVQISDESTISWTVNSWLIGLSISKNGNLLTSLWDRNELVEYSNTGVILRKIPSKEIHSPSHALELENGQFLVSQSSSTNHRVCLVDSEGKILKCIGGKPGSQADQFNHPSFLIADSCGVVLVADSHNKRIVSLNIQLENFKEVVSSAEGYDMTPFRMHFEGQQNKLFVTDLHSQQIFVFTFQS